MNFLFLHPNMPGQYKHLARSFVEAGINQVVFLTEPGKPDIPGIQKAEYAVPGKMPQQFVERLASLNLLKLSRHIMTSRSVREQCRELHKKGFVPDIIIGHLGWVADYF